MSTRANILIRAGDANALLYHHTDGYPEHILCDIEEAFDIGTESWRKGRAEKIASYLCAADPGVMEPQERAFDKSGTLLLQSDIEFFYLLTATPRKAGMLWEVKVYCPTDSFWDAPIFANLKYAGLCLLLRE